MKRYPVMGKATAAVLYVLLFVLLAFSRDGMPNLTMISFYRAQAVLWGTVGAVGLAFLVRNRRSLREIVWDRRAAFALVTAAVILLPMLMKRDGQLMYFSIFAAALVGIFLAYIGLVREMARYYVNLLCALSVYSLLTAYLLRIPADAGLISPPVTEYYTGEKFYFFGFSFVPLTYVKYRNFGIFREPGVYQFFLLLALYLNVETAEWEDAKGRVVRSVILSVTLVTTFATGGLVELALLMVVWFFEKGWYRRKAGKLAAVSLVVLGAAGLAFIVLQKGALYATLVDMFSKFDPKSESMTDRAGSIFGNLTAFFAHPLFGDRLADVFDLIDNNTSSSTLLYAVLGVLGGTLNAAAWVAFAWKKERRLWVNIAVVVILFMSFNTENLITNPVFWLFPMLAVCERVLPCIAGKQPGDTQ